MQLEVTTHSRGGFTLLEVALIAGLVGGLAAWSLWRLGDGSARVLSGGQALIWESLSLARSTATASGREVRLMFHIDAQSPYARRRFLRRIAVQVHAVAGWETVLVRDLPDGIAFLPRAPDSMPGLLAPGLAWSRGDGSALRSSALRATAEVTTALPGDPAERWACIVFSPAGTTGESGDLVLGCARPQPPGGSALPLQFVHSDRVRGASISAYGLFTLVNQRAAF